MKQYWQRGAILLTVHLALFASGAQLPSDIQVEHTSKAIVQALSSQPISKDLLGRLEGAIVEEEDLSEKARLMTVYALGSLLVGKTEDWQKTARLLTQQYPQSEWVTLVSLDHLAEVCTACKGTGRCATLTKCYQCRGRADCGACGGIGEIHERCKKCRETGLVLSRDVVRTTLVALAEGRAIADISKDADGRFQKQRVLVEQNKADRETERKYREASVHVFAERTTVTLYVKTILGKSVLASVQRQFGAKVPNLCVFDSLPARLVDGDFWNGTVYPMGKASYPTVDGVTRTFRRFSASRQEAAMAALEKSSDSAASPATPEATVGESSGTGWFCSNGYVITCYHVVQGCKTLSILTADNEKISVELIRFDKANDLAVLRPALLTNPPTGLSVARDTPKMGDKVFTVGFPLKEFMGQAPKMSDGTVSALTGLHDDPRTLQISAPVQPGNSGGPLCNEDGDVVGVVASKLAAMRVFEWTGDVPQNVNYAIKAGYLTLLMDSLAPNQSAPAPPPAIAPPPDKLETVRKAVVIVIGR